MTEGRSRRFLMPMWEGGGNIPPELGVARRLVARGHQVHVLADPTIEVGGRGGRLHVLAVASGPTPHVARPLRGPPQGLGDEEPPRHVADEPGTGSSPDPRPTTPPTPPRPSTSFRPDAVVPDAFLFGSIIAAQGASLPVALLVPNIWIMPSRGTPPIGPGFAPAKTVLGRTRDAAMLALVNRLFRAGLPPVNAARSGNGLAPLSSFYDQALGVERILVLTSPAFDYAAPTVPDQRPLRRPDPGRPGLDSAVDTSVAGHRRAPSGAGRLQLHLPEPGTTSCGESSRHCRRCRCAPS